MKKMNRVFKTFGIIAAALMCVLTFNIVSVSAAEQITYSYNQETEFQVVKGIITGYTGDMASVTQIVVPASVGGQQITGIGAAALADCPELATIVIPNTVATIESQAFARDLKLSQMVVYSPEEVNNGVITREGNSWDAKVFELPAGLVTLAPDALLTCNSIAKFRVKDSNASFITFTEVQNNDGQNNGNSTDTPKDYNEGEFLLSKDKTTVVRYAPGNHVDGEINIPVGTAVLGNYSFESCDSTNGVVIPSTVTTIGDYGFYGYRGQLIVKFHENSTLATIGAYAFSHLGILKIKLPASLTAIGDYCFEQVRNAQELDISETQISVIPAYAFANNPDLHGLTTPVTLKEIKGYAFSGSENLDTVKFLGTTLEKIEAHTFEGCRTLHEIEIPEGVTAIEDATFSGCTNLDKIILPSTVQTIGEDAFKDCVTIHEMVIPANVTYIAQNSFDGARTDLIDTSLSDAAQRLIQTANLNKGSFVYIGSLKYKLVSAVNNNKANVSVVGVKDKSITKAVVPNTLTYSAGDKTFTFKVTAVGDNAFSKCAKLKSVTVGKNVTSIGKKAFYGDKKLTKLTINSKNLKKIGKQALKGTVKKLKVKVPKAKKSKYKKLLKKAGLKGKVA